MLYTKILLAHAALGNHVETFEGIRDGKQTYNVFYENYSFRFDRGRTYCNIDDTYGAEILSD